MSKEKGTGCPIAGPSAAAAGRGAKGSAPASTPAARTSRRVVRMAMTGSLRRFRFPPMLSGAPWPSQAGNSRDARRAKPNGPLPLTRSER